METEYDMDEYDMEHYAILESHGVREINDDTYEVTGSTGNTYRITYDGAEDYGRVNLWSCTCPARGTCKHIKAVAAAVAELADYHGWDY